jgi:hypothetical protein
MSAAADEEDSDSLSVAVAWAARGDGGSRTTVVRPANTFGIRLTARIFSCGPSRAALVVSSSACRAAALIMFGQQLQTVNCSIVSGIRTNAACAAGSAARAFPGRAAPPAATASTR